MLDVRRFRFLSWMARTALRLIHGMGLEGSVLDPMRPWTKDRAAPPIPSQSFRALWSKRNGAN
jgi:hypothetical protein